MNQPSSGPTRRRPNPLVIWRFGFAIVLLGVGIWLVVTEPRIGGASGRLVGWIVIGYAVVRLGIGYVSDILQKRRAGRKGPDNRA